jgi:hypothetical protein
MFVDYCCRAVATRLPSDVRESTFYAVLQGKEERARQDSSG